MITDADGAVGVGFTVKLIDALFEHPPLGTVYSTVTVPAVNPVTTPPVMLAVPVPDVTDQSPPGVVLVKAGVEEPTQTVAAPPEIAATGAKLAVVIEIVLDGVAYTPQAYTGVILYVYAVFGSKPVTA
ncbi:hypothetical protein D3C85_765870 [compost metagenome]